MNGAFGALGSLAFLLFSIVQLYAGYLGITYHFGYIWGLAAIVVALGVRFTLPITVGAFLCAMEVWHWHWALAALFAAPGLALVVPGMIANLLAPLKRK